MAKRKKNSRKISLWVWFIACASLAGLVIFLLLLSELKPPTKEELTNTKPQSDEKSTTSVKYGFYERLKDTVVPITVDENATKKTKTKDDAVFLLQVASFKSRQDADGLRAKLILLGLSPRIEESERDNGDTWYRIMVGPFASRSKLQGARNVLLSNRFEALLIKRKPEKG